MKNFFTFLPLFLLLSYVSFSQTVDFNKTSCKPASSCTPFHDSPNLCDSPATGAIIFVDLYGAPNYINWKKTTSSGKVMTRSVSFRSQYHSPTLNYGDALALKATFIKNKVYDINIVTSALRDESYQNFVANLRVSLDKVDAENYNNADPCGMGVYNQLPDSRYFNDITPHLIDSTVPFNESLFTSYFQTPSPDNFNYLGLRALPHSGVAQANLMVHKIIVKELNFKFKQSVSNLYCDVPATVTFTLTNPDKIFGVSEYHWDLGPQPNGWYEGNNPARQFITTTDSSLVLQWNGSPAPSKVKVVPYIGSTALAYTYQDAITYNTGFSPNVTLIGDSNIVTISPVNITYTLSNVPLNANIVWELSPTGLGTFTPSGATANFLPNTEASGNALLKAIVTNSCNISKSYQTTLHLSNSCDVYPLNYPANLTGTPTSSPGWTVLSWDAVPYAAMYTVDYMASDGTNHNTFDVASTTTSYYGPSYMNGTFRVQSKCNSGKTSTWSPWQAFSTIPPSACNLPFASNLVAVNACGGGYLCGYIQYSWTPVSGATNYEIESMVFNPSQGIGYSSIKSQTGGSSSIAIMGYYPPLNGTGWLVKFRVRSRCSDNTWTNFSNWSANFALN